MYYEQVVLSFPAEVARNAGPTVSRLDQASRPPLSIGNWSGTRPAAASLCLISGLGFPRCEPIAVQSGTDKTVAFPDCLKSCQQFGGCLLFEDVA